MSHFEQDGTGGRAGDDATGGIGVVTERDPLPNAACECIYMHVTISFRETERM